MSLNIDISLNDYHELRNLTENVYFPLTKLVDKKNFNSILNTFRLSSGKVFPLPIFLDVDKSIATKINLKKSYSLHLFNKEVGKVIIEDIYKINKLSACKKIFQTNNKKHPGVNKFLNKKEYFIGGSVKLSKKKILNEIYPFLKPSTSKLFFKKNKWVSIVGFQTRNIPHRAHEQLLRNALEIADGLFVQPLVGYKKKGDFTNNSIFNSYKILIDKYFPKNKILLGPLYASMWYAGPREAIFHAIIRRNYGCTHFIVGRNHAGVGNFYGKYEAQKIFNKFQNELKIKILKLGGPFYCKFCDAIVSEKSCPHFNNKKYKITNISGTAVRERLTKNLYFSNKIVRKEIVKNLKKSKNIFI